MLLMKLKNYIKGHPRVSMLELLEHFALDEQAMRNLLAMWVKKGKLDKFIPNKSCIGCSSSCSSCSVSSTLAFELYTWIA